MASEEENDSASSSWAFRYSNRNHTVTDLHAPYGKQSLTAANNNVRSRRRHVSRRQWYCNDKLKFLRLPFCDEDDHEAGTSTNSKSKRKSMKFDDIGALSSDSIYDYYWEELLPAIASSLPLLLGRAKDDALSFARWLFINLPSEKFPASINNAYNYVYFQTPPLLVNYTPPNLVDMLRLHLEVEEGAEDQVHVPVAKVFEAIEKAFEYNLQLANALKPSWWHQMWPMLDWKIGVFLWRTCGGLLIVILVASIVPGRIHAYCGKILRWPILLCTYVVISAELVMYVFLRLFIKVLETIFASPRHRFLRRKMDAAENYNQWLKTAEELDLSQSRDKWQNIRYDESTCRHYNWELIKELMSDLSLARERADNLLALAVLQQCTRKNVGGVMSEDLFSYTNTGKTKMIVEEFIEEVVKTTYWLTEQASAIPSHKAARDIDRRDDDSRLSETSEDVKKYEESLKAAVKSERDKLHETLMSWATLNFFSKKDHADRANRNTALDMPCEKSASKYLPQVHRETVKVFLKRARAAYGRTALVLSGGAMLGCYHFGTIKALFEEGCLPNIISGTSAGSVVGAVVCTRSDEEIKRDLDPKILTNKLTCFSRSWSDRMKSVWNNGHLFDKNDWLKLIRWFTNGDLTFEEAYRKTGRVLCIMLSATTKKAPPVLLNYITAPNVVIASAIVASAAVPGFIPPVLLELKDADGNVRSQDANKDQTYWDGSIEQDIPINGLAETFNVQFFLVAQANPHIVPFFFNNKGAVGKPSRWSSGVREDSWRGGFLLSALELYLKNDMKSKFVFLRDLDAAVGFTGTLMTQSYEGTTTIVPQLKIRDYFQLFSNPSLPFLQRCFQGGAVGAYQKIAMMKAHYLIAHALDECLAILEEKEGYNKTSTRQAVSLQKRTSSKSRSHDFGQIRSQIDDEYVVGGFDGMECSFTHRKS